MRELFCLIGCGRLVSSSPGEVSIAILKIGVRVVKLDHLAEPYGGENVREVFDCQRCLHILVIDNNLDTLRCFKSAHLSVGQGVKPLRVPPPAIGRVGTRVAVRVKHTIVICCQSHIKIVDAL